MRSLAPCLTLATLIILSACSPSGEKPDPRTVWTTADTARVNAVLEPLIAAHEFMGAVAFVRDGKVVYSRGAGMADVAASRAFTPATPADGGSLAKTLTAAAVWTLVQEGRIAIDAPVTTYVPEYPYAGTTVRHLIAHTNGLPPYYESFDSFFGPNEVRTTAGLLAVVGRKMPKPRFAPGTRFEYSNLGFDTAALVVERVTGQSIGAFFRSRFFTPLAMDAAFARPGRFADFPGQRTRGYRWGSTGWENADVYDNEAFIGGSNVYFSVLDLARWAGANARGTAIPHAVEVLGSPRPVIDGHSSPINGLSWYCDDSGTRCHYTGANNAFHSLVYWDRERADGVAMISNSSPSPWTLVTFQRDLVATLEGRTPSSSPRPAFMQVHKDERAVVTGRYAATGVGTLTVTRSSEGLRLRIGSGLEFDVFQVAPDEFYVPGPDYFVGFSGSAEERQMHVRSMFVDSVGPRLQ
jgi:CubicO group peptidase (beta-lactamase class C family)